MAITIKEADFLLDSLDRDFGSRESEYKAELIMAKIYLSIDSKKAQEKGLTLQKVTRKNLREFRDELRLVTKLKDI